MKRLLIILALLIIVALVLWKFVFQEKKDPAVETKPQAIEVNSTPFNESLKVAMDAYLKMNEGFVNWDSSAVNSNASQLLTAIDSLRLNELARDSAIYLTAKTYVDIARTETQSILSDKDWTEKRGSLNVLSQNMYDLLRAVQYNVDKVYYQECPMAFGEDKYGYWLDTKKAIRNPYLGTSDPEWGRKMLTCGSTKDSLRFYDQKSKP